MDYDLIIIGGGPAGLSAAIYSGRAKLSTLVLEKGIPGGQLNWTTEVENYPGFPEPIEGPELMGRMRRQAERFGVEIRQEEAKELKLDGDSKAVATDAGEHKAPCVIIATGAGPVELPVKGAKELKGRGVSYCATCDGYFFQDKNIIEVGAGDAGLTEALFLTKFANEVRIVVRHPEDDPHAIRAKDAILRERVMNHEKIKLLWNTRVKEIVGDGKVKSVILEELGTGEEIVQDDVAGVFVNIGHKPATDFLRGRLEMDERGYLITNERMRTNFPGLFAVGDVRRLSGKYAQAVIATADGCIAALEVEKYLEQLK